ncbi:energy-coupling factor transporter transmembrane component T [Candidatus Soleaferrea massiliensis]|uniref:energy-coupling factor transporter transmembrane component T n=1 Tax=Candidatus Soleaferrea massiliensis TaxID=1470354 RepID=UPI0006941A42|nr:energy-coupling factor transporter transmembrane component T [Candidatus Soleaferrea massiliensis]
MKRHLFTHYHPAVIFLYFAGAIILSMCTMHPFFVLLSFLCSGCYCIYLRGLRSYLKGLRWYLVMMLIIAAANALFNGLGLSVLFYLGGRPITVEAILFGLCSGLMLISVLQWFSCYQLVMTSDKFMSLFGGKLPTISMMLAMVFRYIPDTIRKSHEIAAAQRSLTGGEKQGRKQKMAQGVRIASILMSWSMENSLETADSMHSRGYGSGRRSHYANERFTLYDGVSAAVLLALLLLSIPVLFLCANRFQFYPLLSPADFPLWFSLPYAILLCYPLLLEGKEAVLCLRYRF